MGRELMVPALPGPQLPGPDLTGPDLTGPDLPGPDLPGPHQPGSRRTTSRRAVRWLRTVLIGGLMSYRALFDWLSPWILIPSFVVTPLAQILFFAYLGRSAGVESDEFFLIGNALQYSAIPCLFGMTSTIVGERLQSTLSALFVSPAGRLALVLGRSLPVAVNGLAVSLFGLGAGALLLGVRMSPASLGGLAIAIATAVFACTGLGLVNAAFGLRFRDSAVTSNLVFGLLLLFTGANIPLSALPGWARWVSDWLPLTHAIDAARSLAAGGSLVAALPTLAVEGALGVGYWLIGAALLRMLEIQSRRAGSLEFI